MSTTNTTQLVTTPPNCCMTLRELAKKYKSPLTEAYPNLDVGQAYSVQRLILDRYIDGGAVLCGHKIGLTSAPMQELLGVQRTRLRLHPGQHGAARRRGGAGHRVLRSPRRTWSG